VSVFDGGEAGGGADGPVAAGRDRDDEWGGPQGRRAAGIWRRIGPCLVKQADIDGGVRPGVRSEEVERVKDLEQEVRELRRANEILRRAATFFGAELDRQQPR